MSNVKQIDENLPVPAANVQLGTVQATSANGLVAGAQDVANQLVDIIQSKQLFKNIQGRRYVLCEGWTTLAVLMGCTPMEISNERDEDGVYTAVVELRRMADGACLSRASAECGAKDEVWAKRPQYARRSMAATRATSKACRLAFSWVMTLAGYEATPAEEMTPEVLDGEVVRAESPQQGATITDKQVRFLGAKCKEHGLSNDDLKVILETYGYTSRKDILREHMDGILKAMEETARRRQPQDDQQAGEDLDDDVPFAPLMARHPHVL